jgi:hypothetical protein
VRGTYAVEKQLNTFLSSDIFIPSCDQNNIYQGVHIFLAVFIDACYKRGTVTVEFLDVLRPFTPTYNSTCFEYCNCTQDRALDSAVHYMFIYQQVLVANRSMRSRYGFFAGIRNCGS